MQQDRRDEIIVKVLNRCEYNKSSGCLEWQGPTSGEKKQHRNSRGHSYPRMNLDGQTVAVHRVVYTNYNGYIPSKKTIDHTCKNRLCLNILHLEMVTHKQNCKRRDMK